MKRSHQRQRQVHEGRTRAALPCAEEVQLYFKNGTVYFGSVDNKNTGADVDMPVPKDGRGNFTSRSWTKSGSKGMDKWNDWVLAIDDSEIHEGACPLAGFLSVGQCLPPATGTFGWMGPSHRGRGRSVRERSVRDSIIMGGEGRVSLMKKGIDGLEMGIDGLVPIRRPVLPFVVREYAHQRDPSLGEVRSDFTETVYWHPVLVLPESGKTTVEFQLSDDIARYQVAGRRAHARRARRGHHANHRSPQAVQRSIRNCRLRVRTPTPSTCRCDVTNDSDARRAVTLRRALRRVQRPSKLQDAVELAATRKSRKTPSPDPRTGSAVMRTFSSKQTSGADKEQHLANHPDCAGRLPRGRDEQRHARERRRPAASRFRKTWSLDRSGCGWKCTPTTMADFAQGPGWHAARAIRLLRANFDHQLPQHADSRLPEPDRIRRIRKSRSALKELLEKGV